MNSILPRTAVIVALVAWVLSGGVLTSAGERPASSSGAETSISESELNAFVEVYIDYHEIRARYGAALERARDPQEKAGIQREAKAKVEQSLEAQGLTSARYSEIFKAVNGNEELRQKVLRQVEDERNKS